SDGMPVPARGGVAVVDIGGDILLAKYAVPVPVDQSAFAVLRRLEMVEVGRSGEKGDLLRGKRQLFGEMPLIQDYRGQPSIRVADVLPPAVQLVVIGVVHQAGIGRTPVRLPESGMSQSQLMPELMEKGGIEGADPAASPVSHFTGL